MLRQLGKSAEEYEVEEFFREHIYPGVDYVQTNRELLKRSDRVPMNSDTLPTNPNTPHRIRIPSPSMLYGYRRKEAFPVRDFQLQCIGDEMVATSKNICLGSMAACVNIGEHINRRLEGLGREHDKPVNTAVFGLAMNNVEARLFVAWQPVDGAFHARQIKSFFFHELTHLVQLRTYVLNIMDWGIGERLAEIKSALVVIFKEIDKTRQRAAAEKALPALADHDDDAARVSVAVAVASTKVERKREAMPGTSAAMLPPETPKRQKKNLR
ncbi:hypothetical protein B0H66DRAFT_604817 [Apodospora peruviana]|uniref:DUF7924 domain-containing protein n=1 Tax=Apodospora peruviana TaxID=516989 RepID=A0AAE0M256_9PEZI|nr:hypothetical protein B0H66DRAFT_604817 [Apodospora peruviana]